MTDKEQIIIDGVDVSGCSVYKKGKCLISKAKCNARCDYGAIYLKEQLARKTQECEEKQKIIDELVSECKRISSNYKKDEDRYRKAFEEIEKLAIKTNRGLCNNCGWVNTISCIPSEYICGDIKQILDIINKAKGKNNR